MTNNDNNNQGKSKAGAAFAFLAVFSFFVFASMQFTARTSPSFSNRKTLRGAQRRKLVSGSEDAALAEFEKILMGNRHVIVDFYAPWCGFSKQLEPVWDEFAQDMMNADEVNLGVIKVNCDEKPSVCKSQRIRGYPTIRWFEDGLKVEDYKSTRTVNALTDYTRDKLADNEQR